MPSFRQWLVVAISIAAPSMASAEQPFDARAICRTAIAAITGRDLKLFQANDAPDGVVALTYARPFDNFVWAYHCRLEGNRVIWADEPGRWRQEAKDDKADEGRKVAERFGCFNCHGPQGRGTMPNVRAFKGYIPSWDGDDFPELAANEAEIREWIQDGVSKRFSENALARFFLERQPIHMPSYRAHLKPEEIDQLIDYIRWVRANPYR